MINGYAAEQILFNLIKNSSKIKGFKLPSSEELIKIASQSKLGRKRIKSATPYPEFLTKSAIAKHRSLTGSGFEQSDRRFPQPTVCCQILS